MRLLRILGGALAGLLLLALLAAWLAPLVLDWNQYRGAIARAASARLGRPVQIAGPVGLTLLPRPVLVAAQVTLPDQGDGSSAEVAELRLQVGLGALLTGRLEAADLLLQGATMRLPWPLQPGALQQQHPPAWLSGLHATVEDGALLVGSLRVSALSGTLAADPATGTVVLDGMAAAFGLHWRVNARLGRSGADGTAPLEVSLDGQDALQDTGGTFSGQLAADGVLTGRVNGRGRDLSLLLAGPAAPWHAGGRFRGADGLVLADDLDIEIGGVPAHAAVALRLLPEPRLDAALATSRLDLGAWLPNLLQGGGTRLPTSIDLSAEAATLAGGTLRHVRFAFDLGRAGVSLRDAEAVLPGDAAVTLGGRFTAGRFAGAGRLQAPALRDTLSWLQKLAPPLVAILPPGVLQTANLAAAVTLAGGRLTLDGMTGTLDGSPLTGMLTVLPGEHPELSGTLALTGLSLDRWLPPPDADLPGLAAGLARWPGALAGINGRMAVTLAQPLWHGGTLDRLELDAALQGGTLTLRRAALIGPDFTVSASGTLAPGGRLADGRFDGALAHASRLAALLPPGWPAGLLHGPATLHATGAGEPEALGLAARLSLSDLQAEASGTANLAAPGWVGALELQHPGAPRLLEGLGVPGVAWWLGDGSFSLKAGLALDRTRAALSGFTLSAGMLHMTGDLTLGRIGIPALTGTLVAETLPLPLPYARSPDPLPVEALRGWRAQVGLKAAHVLLGLSPALDEAAASLSLADGVLHMRGLTAALAGGRLAGQLDFDAASVPRVVMQGSVSGAALSGPLLDGGLEDGALDGALDLASGTLDATAALQAAGFSPAALLATMAGTASVTVTDGVLTGLDLPSLDSALDLALGAARDAGRDAARDVAPGAPLGVASASAARDGALAALRGGRSDFHQLGAALVVKGGAVTLRSGQVASAAGNAALSGTLDLPTDAADLRLAFTPAHPGAPTIGLRLTGRIEAPHRTPELAALSGWLAAR